MNLVDDLKMTEVRLAGLRIIKNWPGMYVSEICYHLLEGGHITWTENNKPKAPAAARWSGQFIFPLIRAGLLKTLPVRNGERKAVYITQAGLEKIGYGY